ncbi:MAG: DsbA family protein [Maritimibacter sp.]|nr:DsbA family protein [Maritimibacter sp.]
MIRNLPALAPAFVLAAGLAAAPAFSFEINAMSEDEQAAFGDAVRAYLLENPEVIMEAVAELEKKQAAAQTANDSALVVTNHDEIFNDGVSYIDGNPDGDVTFVEFVDYKCGYCRKAFPELKALLEADGNIRIIYKEFPILGPESDLASRFAISAQIIGGDEAYGPLHDALMTMRANVTEDSLASVADELGLDSAAILAGMSDPQVVKIIDANHDLASRLQITGTPTFVAGEQMIRGYVPLDGMTQIVAELREAQAKAQ